MFAFFYFDHMQSMLLPHRISEQVGLLYHRTFQLKSNMGCKLSVEPLDGPQVISNHFKVSTTTGWKRRKNQTAEHRKLKCYNLEFFNTLFHIFNNLTFCLFYFGSLKGHMKWATPFKIHTPPVEDFGKCTTKGSVGF